MRLILDEPRDAFMNMAVDEMLMGSAPCLRVYFWDQPSISIGYFQDVAATAQLFQCAKKNIPVVRRLTGGGLVSHGNDLTFSLVLASDNAFLPRDVKASYLKVTEALRAGLKDTYQELDYARCKDLGAQRKRQTERVCFEQPSCYDLLFNGKKVMGASQRRLNGVILHQSAVFLDMGRGELTKKIIQGFEKNWKLSFEERPLTPEEIGRAERINEERYSSKFWAFRAWPLPFSQNIPGNCKEALKACGHN